MASSSQDGASQTREPSANNPQVLDPEFGERLPLRDCASLGVLGCECCGGQGCEGFDDDVRLLPCKAGFHPCLDVIRFICVFLVVVDHGGTGFGEWNVLYVQSWVLQYLYIIAGICFAMSSRLFVWYQARLLLYLAIGVGLNWLAFVAKDLDWKSQFFDVVFQFWFIVGLALFLLVLWPLKAYLAKVSARQDLNQNMRFSGVLARVALIIMGYMLLKVVFELVFTPIAQQTFSSSLAAACSRLGSGANYWGLPENADKASAFLGQFLSYFELSVTNVYIIVAISSLFDEKANVLWYVIFNTYANRCIQYRAAEARMLNCFDLTMMGLVAYHFGLSHRRVIGEYVVRFYFVVLFCCALLWPVGLHVRLDAEPPVGLSLRIRDTSLEMIFVVLFFTSCERIVDPKIFTKDKLQFINTWALVLFLMHKAVHIIVLSPFNWAVLMSSGIACYFSTWQVRKRN